VNDFHTLSKEYIFTLNVCATQDIYKIIQSQQQEINDINSQINQQQEQIDNIELKLNQLLNNQ
jgi:cell division protein FtsL